MAEVLVQFESVVTSDDGEKYVARACGGPMPDGMWEGWIEFVPTGGGTPLRSRRETTQPNRSDAEYWATGLTPVYLAGALTRALNPPPVRKVAPTAQPVFEQPAPEGGAVEAAAVRPVRAVLDPYAAFEKGELLLRQELGAMSTVHLVNIIRAYELSDQSASVLSRFPDQALIEIIVTAVRSAA